jgi:uncharacterized protein (DUF1501 family)
MSTSRRHFLRSATALSAALAGTTARTGAPLAMSLAGLGSLAAQSTHAADASGYRALVCLYLHGGNDSHNWVVPIDATGYSQYSAVRRELAVPTSRLLPIGCTTQASGRAFGMVQDLAALHDRYEAGTAAVVANVGPLLRPVTKSEFAAGTALPPKLFSHNDQASTWQSLMPEGARSGWGGRMADILMSANQYPTFTSVSASGNAVFLAGGQVMQYQVGLEGPVTVKALGKATLFDSTTARSVLRRSIGAAGNSPFQDEYARVARRSVDSAASLQGALGSVSVPAIPATSITLGSGAVVTLDNDALARQLRIVARMIAAGQAMGMRRQVFMVSMSGFDTHGNQMRDHPSLTRRVSLSTEYFLSAIESLGLASSVTLFTASDFGRTLTTNGSGSDHGWGGHQIIAGGAVRGGEIHGRFPVTALGTAEDVGSGRLLPSTSVTQYAAQMGRWMGLRHRSSARPRPPPSG